MSRRRHRTRQKQSSLDRPGRWVPTSHIGHQGGHVRIDRVREFRDNATGLLRSKRPIFALS